MRIGLVSAVQVMASSRLASTSQLLRPAALSWSRLGGRNSSFSSTSCRLVRAASSSTTTTSRMPLSRSALHHRSISRESGANRRTMMMSTTASNASLSTSGPSGSQIRSDLFGSAAPDLLVGRDVDHAIETLYKADCVCFDVDSTVVNEEGIDVLADFLGYGEQVAALTRQAMEGGMKFQDALKLRLDLLRPSYSQIQDCLKAHPLQLTPGVEQFVRALQASNKDVWLVSGGFRIMIEPVATLLDISKDRIVANTLRFDETTGEFRDFDTNEPTSADMGKPKALRQIQHENGYQTMVMIGDGATDAQAKPPATTFIGFGGVVARQAVRDVADWFVTDFGPLTAVVQYQHKVR